MYISERLTTRQLAVVIGVSQPTARKFLSECGIPRRQQKPTPPVPKGSHLKPSHREAISVALTGKVREYAPGENPRWARVQFNCEGCNALIWVKRCHLGHEHHFCNRHCHAIWLRRQGSNHHAYRGGPATVNCLVCQKAVVRPKWQEKKGKRFFCSQKCAGIWKAENLIGAKVYNWKGGYLPYYGETWLNARRAARDRDKNTCQNCGKTKAEIGKNMDVHHKIRFRNFGLERHAEANALDNLICYCPRCHKTIEEKEANQ